jgi:hypothetical protein
MPTQHTVELHSALPGRDPDIVVQKLRREIGAIRPDQRVELRMNPELFEYSGIMQRFENRAA